MSDKKIIIGQFLGAHGVRGLVKMRSMTEEPTALFDYKPLLNKDGKQEYKIGLKSAAKDHFIVTVDGIKDKDAADALRGQKIYINRDILPKTKKNQFYEADLIGLNAIDATGKSHGQVMAVHDYGAGVFLEIGTTKKDSFMLPFRDEFVPEVDLKAGNLIIAVPEGWV